MKLQTTIDIRAFEHQIEYQDEIFAIGSCFAQRVGDEMERSKFRITTNPTGVLFNPLSIGAAIERFAQRRHVSAEELHEGDLGWFHYDMHSSLNGHTAEEALLQINSAIDMAHEALARSRWVIITLGTAWVYRLIEKEQGARGSVVANCHKQPAAKFQRDRASVEQVVQALQQIVDRLHDKNIMLTLSPIRHLADGACDNALSKATLRLAIEQVSASSRNVNYFPAYEIMLDELRDYRFYDVDMAHPSPLAVEYIWERFCAAALSPKSRDTLTRVMKVVRAAEHRPYNPQSEAYAKHCAAQIKATEAMSEVDFSKEYEYFREIIRSPLKGCLKINL